MPPVARRRMGLVMVGMLVGRVGMQVPVIALMPVGHSGRVHVQPIGVTGRPQAQRDEHEADAEFGPPFGGHRQPQTGNGKQATEGEHHERVTEAPPESAPDAIKSQASWSIVSDTASSPGLAITFAGATPGAP